MTYHTHSVRQLARYGRWRCAPVFVLLLCLLPQVNAGEPWFPVLENQEAWERLPQTKSGQPGEALPVWARILARSLPATTAAMLELDAVQRDRNPLEPKLRAKVRWIAARANGSSYAQAVALADLRRAGGMPGDLETIVAAPERLDERERRVFDFARQLCEAAYAVTDEDVQLLLRDWGPENLCAIVLTVAHANFQDRVFVSLGVDQELGESLAPLAARFDWDDWKMNPRTAVPRMPPDPLPESSEVPVQVVDADWKAASLTDLQEQLKRQQLRAPRIPIPPDELVERQTPPGNYPPGMAARIKWNGVGYGYQPDMTEAWFFAMRRFRDDAGLPADFRQSVFWVVTRSNWCFY